MIILALLLTFTDFELPNSHRFLRETTTYVHDAVNFQILGQFDTYGECIAQKGR